MLVRNSPQFGVDVSLRLPRDFHIKHQVICKEVNKEFPVKNLTPLWDESSLGSGLIG